MWGVFSQLQLLISSNISGRHYHDWRFQMSYFAFNFLGSLFFLLLVFVCFPALSPAHLWSGFSLSTPALHRPHQPCPVSSVFVESSVLFTCSGCLFRISVHLSIGLRWVHLFCSQPGSRDGRLLQIIFQIRQTKPPRPFLTIFLPTSCLFSGLIFNLVHLWHILARSNYTPGDF